MMAVDPSGKDVPCAVRAAQTQHYDTRYREQNYFGYRERIYAPYVASLIAFCGLAPGSRVLDIGCGQGFFSYLFGKHGMKVHGVDISETGIRAAKDLYSHMGMTFAVTDVTTAVLPEQFDCVFVRSCSLYNNRAFPLHDEVTRNLLRHLKADGVFIFAYSSNFSSRTSPSWRYHSLKDVRDHFRRYPNADVFFSTRIDTLLLRRYAFSGLVTRFNIMLSGVTGIGGDLICVFRNASAERR